MGKIGKAVNLMMFGNTAKRIMCVFMAGLLTFSQTAYAAKSVNDLKNELAEKKKETEKLKEQIKGKEADKDAAQARMDELNVEIVGMQDDIDSVQAVIDEKQSEINSANAKIEGLNNDIDKTIQKLKARMKVMYEYGSTSYLEIIFESKGFSDLFTRIAAVQAIVKHDNSMIDNYAAQIEELEAAKLIVETEKQEQVEAKNILTEKQDKLEGLRNEKKKLVEAIESDIATLEKLEKQKEKDADSIQAELNKALAAANKSSSTQVVYKGNGKFGWPSAASTRVTSQFGYRIHPTLKYRKLHRGIDIGAPLGSNVLAAEAGVVLTAGYNGSYGYYITINHGGGYVTLYAHNSKLLVKSGDKVTRGQVIAKCGSTGNSTGPHIHFEVQVNGGLVNPLNYL